MDFVRVAIAVICLFAPGRCCAQASDGDLRSGDCQLSATGHEAIVDCGAQRESTIGVDSQVWCRLVAPATDSLKSSHLGRESNGSTVYLDWTRSLQRRHVKLQV